MTRRIAIIALAFAALAAVLLAIMAALDLRAAAAGWLIGFVFWCGPTVGSLVLLMIHRLTGGRWGVVLYPTFSATAALVPVMAVLLILVLLAMPVLYPWMQAAGDLIPSVSHIYLNMPSFVARSAIAFAGWSMLALALPRLAGGGGTLLAALGLVFHCALISLVPVDWILSIEHPFYSESFGASVAITQLIAALAWVAVLGLPQDAAVEADIGGLLLAMVLAITYVDFMALLIIWYSDLPHKEAWFVEREAAPWWVLSLIAFLLGSAVPILALLLARIRNHRRALRVIGVVELVGLAAYTAYLIAPPFGWHALIGAGLALIAIGGLLVGLAFSDLPAALVPRGRLLDVR